jgi:hypothetical protein
MKHLKVVGASFDIEWLTGFQILTELDTLTGFYMAD